MVGWLVVFGILAYILLAAKRAKASKWRYRPMLLLMGPPGSGKSYKMLLLMLESLAEGRRVLVNFNVRHERVYLALRRRFRLSHESARAAVVRIGHLDTFEDYLDAVDADVFIDEAQDTLSSADWHHFPHEVVQWFAQHRHRLCRVVLASHRYGSIHNYVRELVGDIEYAKPAPWYVKAFMLGVGDRPVLQYLTIKNADEGMTPAGGVSAAEAKRRPLAWNLRGIVLDSLVASCYDTHGGVRPSPMAAVRAESKKGPVLSLKPRRQWITQSAAADGLPSLAHAEYLELVMQGVDAARILRQRWTGAGCLI